MSITRYPLAWPAGWKRTAPAARKWTRFKSGKNSYGISAQITPAAAIGRLRDELRKLGAVGVILSTNLPTKNDGWPYASAKEPADPGAAVYFALNGAPRCLACDRFGTLGGNIAALAAHVDALRAIDRYGVGTLDQAFAGYTALGAAAEVEWWLVLQVPRSAPLASVDAAYKVLARAAHPDTGGSEAEMQRLNVARDAARREIKG